MEKNIIKNRKGNLIDWFMIIPFIFLFAVCIIISLYVIITVDNTQIFAEEPDAQNAIDITKNTILSFDNLMLFVVIGLSLFVIISSALVFNHPAFFFVGFILLCIAVTISAVMANTYDTFATSPQINSTSSQLPKIAFLFDNLPLYIAFMFFASMMVMYISFKKQQ